MRTYKTHHRIFTLILALVILGGSFPFQVFAKNETGSGTREEPIGYTNPEAGYGDFDNVSNTVTIDEESAEDCQRTMSGVLDFTWPKTKEFRDVVIIYDLDAPSDSAQEVTKDIIRNITNQMEFGKEQVGTGNTYYPKDRLMIVEYGGHEGYMKLVDEEGGEKETIWKRLDFGRGGYQVKASKLLEDSQAVEEELTPGFLNWTLNRDKYKNRFSATLCGINEAMSAYGNEVSSNKVYNNSRYTVNGQPRTRKTTYLLLSSAVPAIGIYNDLRPEDKAYVDEYGAPGILPARKNNAHIWYHSTASDYYDGFYHGTDDNDEYQGTLMYRMILRNMESRGEVLKEKGGLRGGRAEFITAFYEDERVFSREYKGYGDGWNRYMRPAILASYQRMQNAGFVTENGNLTKYMSDVQEKFITRYNPSKNRIEIKTAPGARVFSFRLKVLSDAGTIIAEYPLGVLSKTEGNKTYVDMSGVPYGKYRLTYQIIETELKDKEYFPAEVRMFYDDETGEGTLIGDKTTGENYYSVAGNPRTDCALVLSKLVGKKEDLSDVTPNRELDYRHGTFHFLTTVRFSSATNSAQSIKFVDKVDPRLEVMDKWIVKEVGEGWSKVEGDDVTALGSFSQEDPNTVVFHFNRREDADGSLSYASYNNERYGLVVKGRIRRDLSDTQIALMREMLPDGSSRVGVPNTAKIVVDDIDEYTSNISRVIPPELERATVSKAASLLDSEGKPIAWNNYQINLPTKNETFMLRFRIHLPKDISGFRDAFVDDYLDPALEVVNTDEDRPKLFVGETEIAGAAHDNFTFNRNGSAWLLPPKTNDEEHPENTNSTDGEKLHLVFFDQKLEEKYFEGLSDKNADIFVKVKVKDGAKLRSYYDPITDRIVIQNSATVSTNSRDPYGSNTLNILPPMPSVTLVKKAADSNGTVLQKDGEDVLLPGAVYTLQGEDIPESTYTTNDRGEIVLDRLIPGKSYTLKETAAPGGYAKSTALWTINVSESGAVEVLNQEALPGEGYENGVITAINKEPAAIQPEKWVSIDDGGFVGAALQENALLVPSYDSKITYRIKVPIGDDVAAYEKVVLKDKVNELLTIDPNTVKIYAVEREKDPDAPDTVRDENLLLERDVKAHEMIIRRIGHYDDQIGKDVYVEYDVILKRTPTDIEKLFEEYDGILDNHAEVTVNDLESLKASTYITFVNGRITLSKVLKERTGGTDENPQYMESWLPKGESAAFALYKVKGNPDPVAGDSYDPKDEAKGVFNIIGDGTIEGSKKTLGFLEPGTYYFLETQSPTGYTSASGMLPAQGFTIADDGALSGEGISSQGTFTISNEKAGTPTIRKFAKKKGGENTDYTNGVLNLKAGQPFSYALVVKIPDNPSGDVNYTIEDVLPDFFQVENLRGLVKTDPAAGHGEAWERDDTVNSWIASVETFTEGEGQDAVQKQRVKAVVPFRGADQFLINRFAGKEIAIAFDVDLPQSSLAEAKDVLEDDGTYVNTAYVKWRDQKAEASVSVKPEIVRDFAFTKVLGEIPMEGENFFLFKTIDDEEQPVGPKTPLTVNLLAKNLAGKTLRAVSEEGGKVVFKDVLPGYYWLVESPSYFSGDTFLFADRLKVEITDGTLADNADKAIFLYWPDGDLMTAKGDRKIWNNEGVTIHVNKEWVGDEENLEFRPGEVTYNLYRIDSKGAGDTKPVASKTVTVGADGKASAIFQDEPGTKEQDRTFVKFDSYNKPYTYRVEEKGLPNYRATVTGGDEESPYDFTVTNTLIPPGALGIKKVDTEGHAIKGCQFQLTGSRQRIKGESDDKGILSFENLRRGETYLLEEVYHLGDKHVYKEKGYVVTVDEEGQIAISPELGQDEEGNYLIENNPIPTVTKLLPTGEVNSNIIPVGDGNYVITDLSKAFTLQVEMPLPSLYDIDDLYISDTLKEGISMVGGTGRIFVKKDGGEVDIMDEEFVRKDVSTSSSWGFYLDLRKQEHRDKLQGGTLIIKFDAKVDFNLKTFKEKYPEGYDNTVELKINSNPQTGGYYNNSTSNTINVKPVDTSVHFTKTLAAHPDGRTPALEDFAFTLYKKVTVKGEGTEPDQVLDKEMAVVKSHNDGVITFNNVDDGVYTIKETKAPYGYVPMAPLYFKVVTEDGAQKIYKLADENDEAGVEAAEGNLGNVENQFAKVPTIEKLAGKLPEENQEPILGEKYLMDNRDETFLYRLRITIPEEVNGYDRLEIRDQFPEVFQLEGEGYHLKIFNEDSNNLESIFYDRDVTPETGTGTKDIALDHNGGTIRVNDVLDNISEGGGSTNYFNFAWNVGDGPSFEVLAGKTLDFTFKARIWPIFRNTANIESFIPGSEDGIKNTAEVWVNGVKARESTAKVKTSDKFGLKFKKVALGKQISPPNPDNGEPAVRKKYPAYGATFKLEPFEHGPAIPSGVPTTYITDDNGTFEIPMKLDKGTYKLTETRTPEGYVNENNEKIPESFVRNCNYYKIVLGNKAQTGEREIQVFSVCGEGEESGAGLLPVETEGTGDNLQFLLENEPVTSFMVSKKWNDFENELEIRPGEIGLRIQRRIVQGERDEITPAGELVPDHEATGDKVDESFNTNSGNVLSVPVLNFPYHVVSSEPLEGDPLLKYNENGELYDYYVLETDSGANHQVESYTFTDTKKEVKNRIKSVDFIVKKVDQGGTGLPGATFNITHNKGTEEHPTTIVRSFETDGDGKFVVDFLPPNRTYELWETKAPEGYRLDNRVYTVVTDENGVPQVTNPEAEVVPLTVGVSNSGRPTYTMTVSNERVLAPKPIKTAKVKGTDGNEIRHTYEKILYTIRVPLGSLRNENIGSFTLVDRLHQYLALNRNDLELSAKLTKEDNTVEDISVTHKILDPETDSMGPRLTLTVAAEDLGALSDPGSETLTVTFKAGIKNGVSLEKLRNLSGGVPNKVKLTVNGSTNESENAPVFVGTPGPVPQITKTVAGAKPQGEGQGEEGPQHYHMVARDELVTYQVKVPVGDNVLGYNRIFIEDVMAPAMTEPIGELSLWKVKYKGDGTVESKEVIPQDHVQVNSVVREGRSVITVDFTQDYNFESLKNTTVLVQYRSRIKEEFTDDVLKGSYYVDEKNEIRIPNTAKLYFNKTDLDMDPNSPDGEVEVTVTPPEKPVIEKFAALTANGSDYGEYKRDQEATLAQISYPPKYRINARIPHNINNISEIEIRDTLVPVQNPGEVFIHRKGESAPEEGLVPIIDGKTVSVTLSGRATLLEYAGKEIVIEISTNQDVEQNPRDSLRDDGSLVNRAQLLINRKEEGASEAVIRPTLAKLKVTKELRGENPTWPQGGGAKFELWKRWANQWRKIHAFEITNGEPYEVPNLLLGEYELRETEAPEGYVKSSAIPFTVGSEDSVLEKTVINRKRPEISKTVDPKYVDPLKNNEVTYTIKHPITSIEGVDSIRIQDELQGPLVISGPGSLVFTPDDGEPIGISNEFITIAEDFKVITAELRAEDLQSVIGEGSGTLTFRFDAKWKNGVKYEDLTEEMKSQGIPNVAKISINGAEVSTKPVRVKVPVADVTLTKTTETGTLPSGTSATFTLYREKIEGESEDLLLGTYSTSKNREGNHTLTVKDLFPGNYYFQETEAPAGYVLDGSKRSFTVKVDDEGNALPEPLGDNFPNFTVENRKSTVPVPMKYVKSQTADYTREDLHLNSGETTVTYKVEVPVTKVDGWTEFTIADLLDPSLTYVENSSKAFLKDGETVTEMGPEATISYHREKREVLLSYNPNRLNDLKGKKVVFTFDAEIQDVGAFMAAHPDGKVKNEGTLKVSEKSQSRSNPVKVTLPAQLPAPVKTVDGDDQGNTLDNTTTKVLGAKTQRVTYDIRQVIPENITGLTSLTLEDELKDVFEAPKGSDIAVYLGDQKRDDWGRKIEIAQQTLRLNLNQGDLEEAKDKTLRLEIKTALRENADFTAPGYLNQGNVVVANQGKRYINGETTEPILSNVVNITPPGDQPTITKEIVGGNDGNKALKSKDEVFTYVVSTTIPQNVQGYDAVTILDELPDELEVIEATADGFMPEVEGQRVTLAIAPAGDHVGKTVDLKIKGKIKDTVTLDAIARKYQDSAIPNIATLTWGTKTSQTAPVTVTPPGTAPGVKKTVNGKTDETLRRIDDSFIYNITFAVPTNVAGFNTLTLTDLLDPAMEVVKEKDKNKISVYVNEEKDENLTGKVTVEPTEDGSKLTLAIAKGFFTNGFKDLTGKTVRVEVEAKLKDTVNTADAIPNIASLQLNDERPKTSESVTVTAPKGSVILTKVVDGKALTGEQKATFTLYRQEGDAPETTDVLIPIYGDESATVDAANNTIALSGLEPGNYYFKETAAPEGYILNDSPIKFTIVRGQVQPVTLIWNNTGELVPAKIVNGGQSVEVAKYDNELTFAVDVPVSANGGLRSFIIEDTFHDLLTYKANSAVVKAGDTLLADQNTKAGTIDFADGTLTFTADSEQIESMEGKVLRLEFKATLKEDIKASDVTALENGVLTNTATLKVNGNAKPSNTVKVKPLLGTIELTKTADGKSLTAEESATFDLYRKTETTTENRIGSKTTENGKITVTGLIPGTYTFVETAAPTGYQLDTTPHTVTVLGGQTEKLTVNNVSPEVPGIVKEITGGNTLNSPKDVKEYKIHIPLTNKNGIHSFTVEDQVDELLTVVNEETDRPSINIEGAAVTVEGNKISYTLTDNDRAEFEEHNDEVVLSYKVKLKDGVTGQEIVDKYGDQGIPNRASAKINGVDRTSNQVFLKANVGMATLTKTLDNEALPQGTEFTFKLYRVENGDVFIKDYKTVNGKIEVRNLLPGTYKWKEVPVDGYEGEGDKEFTISQDALHGETAFNNTTKTTAVKVEKVWDGGSEESHTPVKVQLFRRPQGGDREFVGDPVLLNVDNSWKYQWTVPTHASDGKGYTYSVDEVNTPAGYRKAVTNEGNDFIITNTYGSAKTDVTAYKKWMGGPEEKPEVTLELWRTNNRTGADKVEEKVTFAPVLGQSNPVTLTNGNIAHTWKNLDVTDGKGNAYTYYVKETKIGETALSDVVISAENYTKEENGLTVTNTYKSPTRRVYAKKTWVNGDDNRPDVTFSLYRNGEKVDGQDKTITGGSTDVVEWKDLDTNDTFGQPYKYEVKETGVPENYVLGTTTGEGTKTEPFTITNTFKAGVTSYTVEKTWENGPANRPAVEVQLYQGENPYGDPVAVVGTYTWTDLPKTDSNNVDYVYSVKEITIGGETVENNKGGDYTVSYNTDTVGKTIITNTYTSPKITLRGTKTWVGDNERDRPARITVELLRDGVSMIPAVTKEVKATDNWEYTFEDLDKTDGNGKVHTYTVKETAVPEGYEGRDDGMDLTNTYVGKTVLEITKKWVDDNNSENTRPEEITLRALQYKDGAPTGKTFDKVFDVDKTTKEKIYTIDNLPKYDVEDNNALYTYKAEEVAVAGYTKSIEGNTITNTLSGTVDIPVKKVWKGGNDRPEVTITLVKDGVATTETITLNQGNNWTDKFTDLPRFENGKVIVYTLEEVPVEGYTTTITGDMNTGFTVTNTFGIVKDQTVNVEKKWVGGRERPEVQVQLFRTSEGGNKEFVGDPVKLNSSNSWKHQWTGLDQTDAKGKVYTYEVDELNTPSGYRKEITGEGNTFTITNTYGIKKGTVTAYKKWVGGNPKDRPKVWFQLIKDGTPVPDSVKEVSGTEVTWENQDLVNPDTSPVTYTLREVKDDGSPWTHEDYTSSVKGLTVTNTYQVKTRDISVEKVWKDGPERKPEIQVALYRKTEGENLTRVGSPITLDGIVDELEKTPWNYTWEGQPVASDDGKAYTYTVDEVTTPVDYTKKVEGNVEKGFTLTNVYTPATRTVEGNVVWEKGPTPRPRVYLKLQRTLPGGEPEDVKDNDGNLLLKELPQGTTTATWTAMATKDKVTGKTYTYTVKQVDATGKDFTPENYTKKEEGLTVTNTYDQGSATVTITKVWKDDGDKLKKRPAKLSFQALQWKEGVHTDTRTVAFDVKAEGTYTIGNLPERDADGKAFRYTVDEVEVPGYEKQVKGSTITNTFTEKKEGTLRLTWKGKDPQAPVTATLFAKGQPVVDNEGNPVTVTIPAGETIGTFPELDLYDEEGRKIPYTIEAEDISGYTKTITGAMEDGFTLTYVYNVESRDLTVTKIWKDNNNAKGRRPKVLTFQVNQILEGKTEKLLKTVAVDDAASREVLTLGSFPVTTADGRAFAYTVEELPVRGYTSEVGEENTFTNTIQVPVGDVTATKIWVGGETPRPTVYFQLLRGIGSGPAEKVPGTAPVALTGTEVTWHNVPLEDDRGRAYTFTVKEVDEAGKDYTPAGYTKVEKGLTVVNIAGDFKGAVLLKLDEETKEVLPGAKFDLYRKGENTTSGTGRTFSLTGGEEELTPALQREKTWILEFLEKLGDAPCEEDPQTRTELLQEELANLHSALEEALKTEEAGAEEKGAQEGEIRNLTLLLETSEEEEKGKVEEQLREKQKALEAPEEESSIEDLKEGREALAKKLEALEEISAREEGQREEKARQAEAAWTVLLNELEKAGVIIEGNLLSMDYPRIFRVEDLLEERGTVLTMDLGRALADYEEREQEYLLAEAVGNRERRKETEEKLNLRLKEIEGQRRIFPTFFREGREDELLGSYVTDATGLILREDLGAGTYTFKETAPPEGYEIGEGREYTFTLADTDEVKVLAVTNRKLPLEQITITFERNYGMAIDTWAKVIIDKGSALGENLPDPPVREGYTFLGWNTKEDGTGERVTETTSIEEDLTLYAMWKKKDTGTVDPGTTPDPDKPDTGGAGDSSGGSGGIILPGGSGGTLPPGDAEPGTAVEVEHPKAALETVRHYAYLLGYPDGTFRPEKSMTRAEVAVMFARLLREKPTASYPFGNSFTDVAKGEWYYREVSYMAEIGILAGYPDGTFRPNDPITRGEFAAIALRLTGGKKKEAPFRDVPGTHWANPYVGGAYEKALVAGYPDGTFRPEKQITRGEVVTIVNRMLNREGDKHYLTEYPSTLQQFRDLNSDHWAYNAIMEATNGHDYRREGTKKEIWERRNGKSYRFPG